MLRGHRGRVIVGFITTYPISVYITTKVLKNKDWLARNQDNVFEWCHLSIRGVLFIELALRIQLGVLVYYKANLIMISLNINLFSP
jgi:hypothetical protein